MRPRFATVAEGDQILVRELRAEGVGIGVNAFFAGMPAHL